jgi:hypothetical protein
MNVVLFFVEAEIMVELVAVHIQEPVVHSLLQVDLQASP